MNTKLILKWALVLSIVVVLNLFFNFAIDTVYDAPKYENFCESGDSQVVVSPQNQAQCVARGGQWSEKSDQFVPQPAGLTQAQKPIGWCDVDFTCRKEYEVARELYNRNVFIALVILGLASLAIGLFVSVTGSAVSLGLSLGGLLSFLVASIRFWSDMDEYLRVIVLGLALILLIWVGIKKFKE